MCIYEVCVCFVFSMNIGVSTITVFYAPPGKIQGEGEACACVIVYLGTAYTPICTGVFYAPPDMIQGGGELLGAVYVGCSR